MPSDVQEVPIFRRHDEVERTVHKRRERAAQLLNEMVPYEPGDQLQEPDRYRGFSSSQVISIRCNRPEETDH